ncbi:hypothetical protein EUV02_03395 [Polymorphobacter arshaanensis]|uniref:DUF5666 domain-containing protein n=1 Tax=Glacieibacterium arshaanense TaxID=2511025 RepID=A0A4Y9ER51_9SPHN|nr:hypothetical protein [Polymorphobacter arshaanensis]TFU06074.1 hypothetical protein EUV02_03395 [Polymorphobacter arshaanensis]
MKILLRAAALAMAPVLLTATAASAQMMGAAPQAAPPVGVRGTVTSVAGTVDTGMKIGVTGKNGKPMVLLLAPKSSFVSSTVIGIDAIKPNSFIGTAAEPGPNGTLVATEVHVFPESMRGVGEGHRPWDTSATSSMTNGNVDDVTEGGLSKKNGRTLTVNYKGGKQTVYVPVTVPIVAFAPADATLLVKGAKVFTFAQKQPDGSLVSNRLVVGVGGSTPPM